MKNSNPCLLNPISDVNYLHCARKGASTHVPSVIITTVKYACPHTNTHVQLLRTYIIAEHIFHYNFTTFALLQDPPNDNSTSIWHSKHAYITIIAIFDWSSVVVIRLEGGNVRETPVLSLCCVVWRGEEGMATQPATLYCSLRIHQGSIPILE